MEDIECDDRNQLNSDNQALICKVMAYRISIQPTSILKIISDMLTKQGFIPIPQNNAQLSYSTYRTDVANYIFEYMMREAEYRDAVSHVICLINRAYDSQIDFIKSF